MISQLVQDAHDYLLKIFLLIFWLNKSPQYPDDQLQRGQCDHYRHHITIIGPPCPHVGQI